MKIKKLLQFTFLLTALLSTNLYAELEIAKLFSDHMVLQRDKVIRVWGWADPGASVELCLADECLSGLTDDSGAWEVSLNAQPASGPLIIRVVSGEENIEINDVYFGDVWLAGGQSNMEWKMSQLLDNLEAEYADSNYPQIRFFTVENRISFTEQEKLEKGAWLTASRETLPAFSAIAWLFAKQNHQDKDVAVGIIDDNWGGTPAEAWVSRDALEKVPAYRGRVEEMYADIPLLEKTYTNNETAKQLKYYRLNSQEDTLATNAWRFDFDDSAWKQLDFPSNEPFEHLIWLRRQFELENVPKQGVTLDLGDLVQEAFVFVNEELIAVENWSHHSSRHVIPASNLRQGTNLIALRIGNSWNNIPGIGQLGNMFLEVEGERVSLNDNWTYSNTVEPPLPIERRFEHESSVLFNGMIHPVRRYGMRGVIWYQGEANVAEAPKYGALFKSLINNWRDASGQELAFLFVQLAGFTAYHELQPDSWWAEIRHQQQMALELPLTGMATAFDIGEEYNVHPRYKQDVAKRLWLTARNVVFGDKIHAAAPELVQYNVQDDRVTLFFDSTAGKLELTSVSDKVMAFILAGEDGVYYPATGTLEGNKVTVWSESVKKPRALKYGWNDFPKVNLYSNTGLPVLPFKIDQL